MVLTLSVRKTGCILLGCTPPGVDLNDLRGDLEKVSDVQLLRCHLSSDCDLHRFKECFQSMKSMCGISASTSP